MGRRIFMSLRKYILQEYIEKGFGDGFKGWEYFKYKLTKDSCKWIEEQVAKNTIKGDSILHNRNDFITTHGSQYLYLNVNYNKSYQIRLRLSTHRENIDISKQAHYIIETWITKEREIIEQINEFIDYAVLYFDGAYKTEQDMELTPEEKNTFETVQSNRSLSEPTSYEDLSVIHRKATNKKIHGNPSKDVTMINLP